MKRRFKLSLILIVTYIPLAVIFVFNSGAGHGWGIGPFFLISLPGAGLALLLASVTNNDNFLFLMPVFAIIQWALIGYIIGRRQEGRLS